MSSHLFCLDGTIAPSDMNVLFIFKKQNKQWSYYLSLYYSYLNVLNLEYCKKYCVFGVKFVTLEFDGRQSLSNFGGDDAVVAHVCDWHDMSNGDRNQRYGVLPGLFDSMMDDEARLAAVFDDGVIIDR